jgi:heme/copper-type cytochrome/quinol oxidase subunit 2
LGDFLVHCVYFTPRPWFQRRARPVDADDASTGCGGETVVFWLVLYASLTIPVAVIVAVVARHYRTTAVDVLAQWGPAMLLGVLWPVVLVVLAQLAISVAMARAPSVLGSIRGFSRV